MLTYIQAVIMGAVQGATELFPVSSLGHSVILPHILGWGIDQNADFFLNFLIATHLATSLVLFAVYFRDWMKIIAGIFRTIFRRRLDPEDVYARLGWLLILGTVPAGLLGLLLEHRLKDLFASPSLVALMLIANGVMLYGAEFLMKREPTETLSWKASFKIGCAQALALIPGLSRTGSTLGGGLLVGLNHRDAARFSFMLATPIIFAAAVLKLPGFIRTESAHSLGITLAGAATAAVCAYLSVKFLTKYFENKTLKPFAAYCAIAGIAASVILIFR